MGKLPVMSAVYLIHWNAEEAEERAERLRAAGYEVACEPFQGASTMRRLREDPPSAVVIDLSRLPSQGRDVALGIRATKSTRHFPIVFVDGDPEKVARFKKHLPDAVYTGWSRIRSGLKRAIAHPPAEPVVPRSRLDGYAGTALPKKLGIKAGSVVALAGPPPGFEDTLGELPQGAVLRKGARGPSDVTIWFTKSSKDLERRIQQMATRTKSGVLWIAWPKKASGLKTDLSQVVVRKVGLAAGIVDYKICSIDDTWSGLLFTKRK